MWELNKQSLCGSRYDFDVSSCLFLVNDAQAALIRLLISPVSFFVLHVIRDANDVVQTSVSASVA